MKTFSQFENYLAKHGKIQTYKTVKTNSKCESHKKSQSTQLRLTQMSICIYTYLHCIKPL